MGANDGGVLFAEDVDQSSQRQQSLSLHLRVSDPDVLAAIHEYPAGPDRERFTALALKVGVLSLRAAKGVIDGEQIRVSGEKLLQQMGERLQGHQQLLNQSIESMLRTYFDPADGHFSARVLALTSDDGELASVMRRHVGTEVDRVRTMFDGYVGENGALSRLLEPGEANAFAASLNGVLQSTLNAEHELFVKQFSLDHDGSALSRLVRELKQNHGDLSVAMGTRMQEVVGEFSLDRPDSALSRLVGRVEAAHRAITSEFSLDRPDSALHRLDARLRKEIEAGHKAQNEFQQTVLQALAGMQAQRKSEARSTTHGFEFEANVGALLADLSGRAGDVLEETGATTGQIRLCKVGDFVVTLGPDNVAAGSKIVVEAKESASYSVKSTLEECDEARRNRGCQVSLFVHSAKTAPQAFEALTRHGNDIVVVWDAEDRGSDVVLKAGMALARALCVKRAQHSTTEVASWSAIDKAIEQMRKQIVNFAELRTSAETIGRSAEKSLERIRIMSTGLEAALASMDEHLSGLRASGE